MERRKEKVILVRETASMGYSVTRGGEHLGRTVQNSAVACWEREPIKQRMGSPCKSDWVSISGQKYLFLQVSGKGKCSISASTLGCGQTGVLTWSYFSISAPFLVPSP